MSKARVSQRRYAEAEKDRIQQEVLMFGTESKAGLTPAVAHGHFIALSASEHTEIICCSQPKQTVILRKQQQRHREPTFIIIRSSIVYWEFYI